MKEAANTDIIKVCILAVVLTGVLVGLFIWNQQAHILDPLASQVYAVFVSQ